MLKARLRRTVRPNGRNIAFAALCDLQIVRGICQLTYPGSLVVKQVVDLLLSSVRFTVLSIRGCLRTHNVSLGA